MFVDLFTTRDSQNTATQQHRENFAVWQHWICQLSPGNSKFPNITYNTATSRTYSKSKQENCEFNKNLAALANT